MTDGTEALAERVAALEARLDQWLAKSPALGAEVLTGNDDHLAADADAEPNPNAVGYWGTIALQGEVDWRITYHAPAVTELPTEPLGVVLAALGHPTRIAITQELLRGNASAAQLQERFGGSAGQVYHHLQILVAASVVTKVRGAYRIEPRRAVPILTMLLAAADVGDAIR